MGNVIQNKYGSKSGLILSVLHYGLDNFGAYRAFHHVQWNEVRRLIYICHGNICRSAYADALTRIKYPNVTSYGLAATRGNVANAAAIKTAEKLGVDLKAHRAQPFSDYCVQSGDLLIAMEPGQARNVRKTVQNIPVTLLGLWAAPGTPYLHDPYGLSTEYFSHCFQRIDSAVTAILTMMQHSSEPAAIQAVSD